MANAKYILVIKTTENYPQYKRVEETFTTLHDAQCRMDEISDLLQWQCNKGHLQDYDLEITKKVNRK